MASRWTVSIALILVVSAPVLAQTDLDPNGLGFYADQGGLANSLETPPGSIPKCWYYDHKGSELFTIETEFRPRPGAGTCL